MIIIIDENFSIKEFFFHLHIYKIKIKVKIMQKYEMNEKLEYFRRNKINDRNYFKNYFSSQLYEHNIVKQKSYQEL